MVDDESQYNEDEDEGDDEEDSDIDNKRYFSKEFA